MPMVTLLGRSHRPRHSEHLDRPSYHELHGDLCHSVVGGDRSDVQRDQCTSFGNAGAMQSDPASGVLQRGATTSVGFTTFLKMLEYHDRLCKPRSPFNQL